MLRTTSGSELGSGLGSGSEPPLLSLQLQSLPPPPPPQMPVIVTFKANGTEQEFQNASMIEGIKATMAEVSSIGPMHVGVVVLNANGDMISESPATAMLDGMDMGSGDRRTLLEEETGVGWTTETFVIEIIVTHIPSGVTTMAMYDAANDICGDGSRIFGLSRF